MPRLSKDRLVFAFGLLALAIIVPLGVAHASKPPINRGYFSGTLADATPAFAQNGSKGFKVSQRASALRFQIVLTGADTIVPYVTWHDGSAKTRGIVNVEGGALATDGFYNFAVLCSNVDATGATLYWNVEVDWVSGSSGTIKQIIMQESTGDDL